MGKQWLILSGVIHHITATDTNVFLGVPRNATELTALYYAEAMAFLKSTIGSSTYNLFSTRTEGDDARVPQWQPIIIDDSTEIRFLADTSSELQLTVLEW